MLVKEPDASWSSRVCRELRKSIMISEYHPLAFEYLRSFPAIVAERQRHLLENRNIIHPLSIFSLAWNSFMIIINISIIMFSALRVFIMIEPAETVVMNANDVFLVVMQAICFLDMIICFNTGHLESKWALIELNRRRITWAYIRSFWLSDLLSCVPVSFLMLLTSNQSRRDYLIPDILTLARAVRIKAVLNDLSILLRALTVRDIWYRLIRYILMFILAVHSFTCLLFLPSVCVYYVHGEVPRSYTWFLDFHNVSRAFYELPSSQRYRKGMFVAVSALFSTGFHMFRTHEKDEIIVNSVILLFGAMFKMYTIVLALNTYMTMYNSTLRYQELMDQVEKYMHHHQFPAFLTRRLRDFYSYSFQGHYYKEIVALGCLSAHLRNEIRLHTLQTWIDKVPVLRDLPSSVLGRLMGYLEPQVYMQNDLVFHVGDVGNYMYFISTGTVALYSMRGIEMYHFEDGDFFGALSLVTLGSRRMTTLIAVEITHVYRLSYDHLRDLGPEPYGRIKSKTVDRFSKIMIDGIILLEELPRDDFPQT